ncbi:hypothetical protein BN1723_017576, partial [Verticillium longisporum]
MDLRIHMNDVKAAVPLFTNQMSYINQALVRPIVAYINAKKTYIPISCRIVKRASDFDGSWTVFDCGLMDDLSAETYEAFARDVENQQSRVRRFRKVGFWTLSLAHEHDAEATPEDDGNYTQFDVTIANVNVTLSFLKWWNGKGFLQDVEVKGVRGVVDRTSVHWSDEPVDPLSYRHEHQPGDFEIDSFKLEDVLVTIHQPGGFRPFSVSIFSAELPQLRKRWLFYDFLSATHMSGSYDGSLFTIHPRQVHGAMAGDNRDLVDSLGDENVWKKFSRLRIDGMKLDHLNRGVDGPFGWIYEGNVDIVADVMFPVDADEGITKVMSDFYDQLEEI